MDEAPTPSELSVKSSQDSGRTSQADCAFYNV